jgi:hypothetical protein
MKRSFLWVLLAALVILFGSACGGGGGTSSSGNGDGSTDGGTITNVHIAATLQGSGNPGVDTSNLAVGDVVSLRLLGTNAQGQTVTASSSNWTTNAPGSVATVTSNGTLTANGPTGGVSYTVSAQGPNGTVSSPLVIKAVQALAIGVVRNVNGTGVSGVKVKFYNDAGGLVGQATTGSDGVYRANLPTTATGFTIDIETADPGSNPIYYRQFDYTPPGREDALSYLNGELNCRASIPALTLGATTQISPIVLAARASGPPPPPSGCLNG